MARGKRGDTMLWNAPIWLNEMLVAIIKFLVELFPFIRFISAAGLIYIIICKIKNKRPLIYSIKDKDTLILSGSLLAACIGLFLFYLPQQVIHDDYSFDEISIKIESPSSTSDRITINDKEGLDEFVEMFRGRICRRSIGSGDTMMDSDVVFMDLIVFDNNKPFPLHFIVTQGDLRRYTAGNTDFIYIVEDDEHILSGMVFEYARKYMETGN